MSVIVFGEELSIADTTSLDYWTDDIEEIPEALFELVNLLPFRTIVAHSFAHLLPFNVTGTGCLARY